MSVSGGVSGVFDSQEAVSQDASDGAGCSSSSPEEVEEANNERAEFPGVGAGELQTQMRNRAARSYLSIWRTVLAAVLLLSAQHFSVNMSVKVKQMSVIRISVAGGRVNGVPHASMQVALHVTMRQTGAKASNRVSVSGGVSGVFDSQEAVSQDASDGGFNRWLGGNQHQRLT